jgi:hypothetical protein
MNTRNRSHTIDVHAALARAHAERAEVMRAALNQLPALFKRLAARLQSKREPQLRRQFSAWA